MNCSLKGDDMHELYFSVDIETTGGVPGKYSMFEIGIAAVNFPDYSASFPVELLNDNYDENALRATQQTVEGLRARERQMTPVAAMEALAAFVERSAAFHGKKPIFVGNNAPFDWMFIAWYFETFDVHNPFGHSALDMKAYFAGMTSCTWSHASLTRMAQVAGIEFSGLPHEAEADAIIQANIFAKLLLLNRRSL